MKPAAKFLFDEDFATGEKPTISVLEAERRRADAESIAYRNGFTAGLAQAEGETARRLAGALELIADGLTRIDSGLTTIETRLETEAVEVAVAVGAKLAPELIAREPFVEVSALATECFRHLVKTPHVAVRIGSELYDAAKDKLDEIARARGFEGRLTIEPDPELEPGDCRIEWADGGLARDRAAAMAGIDETVARYVAARTSA